MTRDPLPRLLVPPHPTIRTHLQTSASQASRGVAPLGFQTRLSFWLTVQSKELLPYLGSPPGGQAGSILTIYFHYHCPTITYQVGSCKDVVAGLKGHNRQMAGDRLRPYILSDQAWGLKQYSTHSTPGMKDIPKVPKTIPYRTYTCDHTKYISP